MPGPVVEPPGVAGDQLKLQLGGGCVELFLKPGLPVDRSAGPAGHGRGDGGREQVALAGEGLVDGRHRDAGPGGDVLDPGSLIAAYFEFCVGGFDDPEAGGGRLGLAERRMLAPGADFSCHWV